MQRQHMGAQRSSGRAAEGCGSEGTAAVARTEPPRRCGRPSPAAFALLLRAALGILLAISASLATAADFLVDRWTIADGLPVNGINAIQRDANGYLWLATFGGLA